MLFKLKFRMKKTIDYMIRICFSMMGKLYSNKYSSEYIKSSEYQDSKRRLLSSVPFYSDKLEFIDEGSLIDKDIVRDNLENFKVNKRCFFSKKAYTSGTSGTPALFIRDISSMVAEQYFQDNYFEWSRKYKIIIRGEHIFDRKSKKISPFVDIPWIKECYVSSYHLSEENLEKIVEKLKKIKNKCLWAYPSSAYLLAEYCLRKNIDLKFDIVATSSEMLYDFYIEKIEKAFGCRVKDWYGQTERVTAIARCSYGNYHFVDGYSEYKLNDSLNGKEIVGSTVHNFVMPLINYRTGDIVDFADDVCGCGKSNGIINGILGRECDFLNIDGRKIGSAAFTISFKKLNNIKESQIVQRKDGKVEVRIVTLDGFIDKDRCQLIEELSYIMPKEIIVVREVKEIQQTKNGKRQFIIAEQ